MGKNYSLSEFEYLGNYQNSGSSHRGSPNPPVGPFFKVVHWIISKEFLTVNNFWQGVLKLTTGVIEISGL